MKLCDIFSADCILIPVEATEKTGAITNLVDVLASAGKVSDRDLVLQAILDREATKSTGMGFGLAVPHGKCSGCASLVMAAGRPIEPIPFGSPDGEPVSLIMLLASPMDQTGPHLQALARITRMMLREEFRHQIQQADTPDDFYRLIMEQDDQTLSQR